MAPKKKNKRILDVEAFALLKEIEKQNAIRLNGNYYVVYPKKLEPDQLKIIKDSKTYNKSDVKAKRNAAKNALAEDVTIYDFKSSNQMMGQFMLNGSKLLEKDWRFLKHASPEMDWVKKSLAALNNTLSEGLSEFISENGVFDDKAYMKKINTAFDEFIEAGQNYADSRNPSSWAGKRRRRRVVDLLNNAREMKKNFKTLVDSFKEGSIEFDKMDAQTKEGLNSWNLINQVSSREVTQIEWQNQGNSTDVYKIMLKGEDGKEYYLKENLPFLNENLQGFLTRRMKQLDVSKKNKEAGGNPNMVEERLTKITDKDYDNCTNLLKNLSNALKDESIENRQALSDKFSKYFAHNFDDIFKEFEIYNRLVDVEDDGDIDKQIDNAENDLEKQALRIKKMVLEDAGLKGDGDKKASAALTAAQWLKIKLNLNEKNDKVFYDSIKNLNDKELETLFRVTLGKEVELFGQMSASKMQNGDDKAAINNTATSRVAEHLGFDDVITKSKTMLVKFKRRDGTEVNQLCTVCEAAPGIELVDLMKMAEEKGTKVVYSPNASRQLLRLQAADTLTLQKDRHGRNLKCMHHIDKETGNIIVDTIKAYDNDMSFDAINLKTAFNEESGEPKRNQFLPAMDTVVKKDSALYKFVLGHYFGIDTVSPPHKAEIPKIWSTYKYGKREYDLTKKGGLSYGPKKIWGIDWAGDLKTKYRTQDMVVKDISEAEKKEMIEEFKQNGKGDKNWPNIEHYEGREDDIIRDYALYKFYDISEEIRKIWRRPKKEQEELANQLKERGEHYSRDDIYFKTNLSDEDILKLGELVEKLEKLEEKFDFSPAGDMYDIPDMDAFIKSIKYMYYTVYGDNIDHRLMKHEDYKTIKSEFMNEKGDLVLPSMLHYDHEAYKSLQKSVNDFRNPNSLLVNKLKELGLSQDKIDALRIRNEEMLEKITTASKKAEKFYKIAGWDKSPKNKFLLDKEDYKNLDNLTDYAIDPANTYLSIDNDNYLAGQKFMMNVKGKMKAVPYKDLMDEGEKVKAETYNEQICSDEKRWKYKEEMKQNRKTYENNTADYTSTSKNAVEYVKSSIDDNVYAISHSEFSDQQKLDSKIYEGLFNKRLLSEMKQPIAVDAVKEMMKPGSQMKSAFKSEFNSAEGKIFANQMSKMSGELFTSGDYKKMTEKTFDNMVRKGFEHSMDTVFNMINDPKAADKNAKIGEIASAANKMKNFAQNYGVSIKQDDMLNKFMTNNPNAFTPDQANRLKEAMKPQPVRVQGKQGPAAGLPQA